MKITLIAAITADGFIADENGNGNFSSEEDKLHLREFLHNNSVDGFILGRKTASEFAAKLAHKSSFVFTRNVNLNDTHNVMYCRDVAEFAAKTKHLKQSEHSPHFALLGGGEIYNYFLNNKLVDKMLITIEENITFRNGISLNLAKHLPDFNQVHVLQLSGTTKVIVYDTPHSPKRL